MLPLQAAQTRSNLMNSHPCLPSQATEEEICFFSPFVRLQLHRQMYMISFFLEEDQFSTPGSMENSCRNALLWLHSRRGALRFGTRDRCCVASEAIFALSVITHTRTSPYGRAYGACRHFGLPWRHLHESCRRPRSRVEAGMLSSSRDIIWRIADFGGVGFNSERGFASSRSELKSAPLKPEHPEISSQSSSASRVQF